MGLKDLIASDVDGVFTNVADFGDLCSYQHGNLFLNVQCRMLSVDPQRVGKRDICGEDGVVARATDIYCSAASLVVQGVRFEPGYGDQIIWTDVTGQPRVFVPFPRVAGDYFENDSIHSSFKIYAMELTALTQITFTPAKDVAPFTINGIVQRERDERLDDGFGTEFKARHKQIYIPTQALTDQGIKEIHKLGVVSFGEQDRWNIELRESKINSGVTRLGLLRAQVTQTQGMEQHATL